MATRTLETRRDRLITMMVLPLMSCGARLPIYALMIPAFFAPKWQGPVLWIIYVTASCWRWSGRSCCGPPCSAARPRRS